VDPLGDKRAAVILFDKAIKIQERLVIESNAKKETRSQLALANTSKQTRRHLTTEQPINRYSCLAAVEGATKNDLASLYLNKANVISGLGEHRKAIELYDKAIDTGAHGKRVRPIGICL